MVPNVCPLRRRCNGTRLRQTWSRVWLIATPSCASYLLQGPGVQKICSYCQGTKYQATRLVPYSHFYSQVQTFLATDLRFSYKRGISQLLIRWPFMKGPLFYRTSVDVVLVMDEETLGRVCFVVVKSSRVSIS
jgi:hypothetical protein